MKKVALITADNGNGGAARATRRIAKGLTKLAGDLFSIELICNGISENGYFQRKPIYHWYTKLIYKNAISSKIFKAIIYRLWKKINLRQKKDSMLFFRIGNSINNRKTFDNYDILHVFWGQNFINPGAIADLNKNVIVTLHDMWFLTGGCAFSNEPKDYKEKYLNIFGKRNFDNQYQLKKKLLFSSKTKIIVTSNWMKKKCIDFGIEKNKITKIFNYIPNYYKFLDMKYESMKLINWSDKVFSKKIIYFVGNINDFRKGFDFLVAAINLLTSDIKSKIAIQILGSTQSQITKLDNLNINYLSLGIFHDEISQIIAYNAADLLICPSTLDNSPNVIAEAQMCGLPTFVRSGTGASEMIEEGLSGKIFSHNRVEDLKAQISDFVLGKLKFNSFIISEKARITYSLENTCKKYIDLYNNFEPI